MTIHPGREPELTPVDGLSHVVGDRTRPLLEETIPARLAATVARFGEREAAVFCAEGPG